MRTIKLMINNVFINKRKQANRKRLEQITLAGIKSPLYSRAEKLRANRMQRACGKLAMQYI